MQIASAAEFEGLNEDSIWHHFVNVTIPAIQHWQERKTKDGSIPLRLGELMVKLLTTVNHISEVAIITCHQLIITTTCFYQVLRVINPTVTYHLNHKMLHGVAINLKGFLQLLDKYSLKHSSEKALRACLDDSCLKRNGKQHFLSKDAARATSILRGLNSVCKVCICIPKEQVPSEVFEFFEQGNTSSQRSMHYFTCGPFVGAEADCAILEESDEGNSQGK